MDLPPSIRQTFRDQGRRGGLERARRLAPAARTRIARMAAITRWTRTRFGGDRFGPLGLPGGALIDQGLEDLAAGRESTESLAVSLAAPRLRREGVPVPAATFPEADHRLYRQLEEQHGGLAHARYLAWLEQLTSFADACRYVRSSAIAHA